MNVLQAFLLVITIATKASDGKIEGQALPPIYMPSMAACLERKATVDKQSADFAKKDLFAYSAVCVDASMKIIGEMDANFNVDPKSAD